MRIYEDGIANHGDISGLVHFKPLRLILYECLFGYGFDARPGGMTMDQISRIGMARFDLWVHPQMN